jgi:MinD superfamily P-loop ATPase
MKQLAIISGKGGTGKTIIAASFASLAKDKITVDCDVDAADLHLLLHPKIKETIEFRGSKYAVMDAEKCIECGRCEESCRFNAIKNLKFDPIKCEGCGVCVYVCPADAITLKEAISGYAYISETKYGQMSHARLNIAEEASGKLITLIRNNARRLAEKSGCGLILIDGPPGIGCPVIASLSGVDMVLAVTEPTVSGIHDLERILGVAKHFNTKSLVCINKYDINIDMTKRIESYCEENDIEVVGKIPYDPIVTKAMVAGKPVVEFSNGRVSKDIEKMWKRIEEMI